MGPLAAATMAIAAHWILAFIPGRLGALEIVLWGIAVLETPVFVYVTLAVIFAIPSGV